jgi:hypothetical protein
VPYLKMRGKMKILTKDEAHNLCAESWNNIAENRIIDKSIEPLNEKYEPYNNCFACEYYIAQNNGSCEKCPFIIFSKGDIESVVPCQENDSPYQKWHKTKERKYAIETHDLFIDLEDE